ncbi:MAG: DUF1206 domain-containing protein [Ilumatobacter sp.]|nr:DUF1206 domain-containing protein [Ilumatobacter sp.]
MTVHAPTRSSDPSHDDTDVENDDVGSDAAEDFVRRHPGVVKFARVGWAAKGVVYLLTGILAFTIAADPFGSQSDGSSGQADPSGAVATIARQPFGTILMWTMAAGLFLYAAWRIVTVLLPADVDGHSILRRIGYTVSAATYVLLGVTAISLATKPGSSSGGEDGSSQDSQVTKVTRSVMEWPAGRWLIGLAGIVVIGVACYFLYKAISASFEKELEHRSIGPFSWKAVRTAGRIGWFGRAAMMALIGVFVARAAIQFDPDEARGLDDSLRRVVDNDLGMVLVVVVAAGLTLYGAFCVLTAPARKVVATDEDTVAS